MCGRTGSRAFKGLTSNRARRRIWGSAPRAMRRLAARTSSTFPMAMPPWRAFTTMGVHEIYAPGSYHSSIRLNQTVDIGAYASVRSPDDPILVRMMRAPCKPGLDERAQHRVGRAELLGTAFEVFERHIRDQLARTLGPVLDFHGPELT